ncbi:flippase [Streptococcus equinus]|uniref:Membrane protein involved in the export of O-antigen and teichoic acid n=1 Tax=Streptococcus equinus TaxID=1335 RepID=A0A1G9INP3_STREI|nr:flippase [Streptococcus equinus]SDL26524.1 Membrane protein involved in the export of O-antigen and teichoic acid [Streptococcus equinus]
MISKKIVKNTAYNFAYNLLNVIFPLVTVPVVSRILLSSGLGKVNYAFNIVGWFTLFAALGIPRYGIREVAKQKANQSELNKCFSEIFLINTVSTIISSLAYVISIIIFPYFRKEVLLYFVAGIQLFFNVFNVDWFYQGLEEYGYITKRSFFVKLISLIAILCLVRSRDDYILYALIQNIATIGNYVLNVIHLRKYISFSNDKLHFKKHLKSIFLLLSTTLAISIYSLLDVTMVGAFCGDSAVGYYTNVHKIINTLAIVSTSLGGVLLPQLVSYYSKNELGKLGELSEKVLSIILVVTVPISTGLFILSPYIVSVLFGNDFIPAIPTMKIFAPFIVLNTLGNFYGTQLLMAFNKEKELLYTVVLGAVLNFTFNILLIRIIQQNGAAVASVVEELIVMLIQRHIAKKAVKISINYLEVVKIMLMNVFLIISVLLVCSIFSNPLIIMIVSFLTGAISYALIGYIVKEEVLCSFINKKIKVN